MSSKNITVVWDIHSKFDNGKFIYKIKECGFIENETKNEYELSRWKSDGLTLIQYEKKIMIQGRTSDNCADIIQNINTLEGLSLDVKSKTRIQSLFKKLHGSIMCEICGKPHYLINSKVEGIDVILYNECDHKCSGFMPFNMMIYRILPDINILISRHLSRLIQLNYFINSEIVLSDYIMNSTDHYIGSKNKKSISIEIENIRQFNKEGKLSVIYYKDSIILPSSPEKFNKIEDENLLDIAKITNSILLTADTNFKDRAILQNRPVIFLSDEVIHALKIISEIRNP